jgi:hypothetical protein
MDFYRFGKVKGVLIGREIPDEMDLLEAGTEILNAFQVLNYDAPFEVGPNVLKG